MLEADFLSIEMLSEYCLFLKTILFVLVGNFYVIQWI
jgi:hypothetical protein